MNVVAIVQARMGSTRLPGKVLLPFGNGRVLDNVIDCLYRCKEIDKIVLAIPDTKKDDILEGYAIGKKLEYYRGSEKNVLSRYYEVAKKFNATNIIRITGDCPLLSHALIDEIIKIHLELKDDYTSNTIIRTFPKGQDVEVFTFKMLSNAFKNAKQDYDREHVTPYIKKCAKEQTNIMQLNDESAINLSIDTQEDYERINKLKV